MSELIELHNIRKSYQDHCVLDNLSLTCLTNQHLTA